MRLAVRVLYNLLLPIFCVLAAPAWILKMARRGGLSPRLWERLGAYREPPEFEPSGVVYIHAVSVGEVLMALSLIERWRKSHPEERFVLAATTSTGFQLAEEKAPGGVRVIYSPLDFSPLLRRVFNRFTPRLIVLVDSEIWPNLLHVAARRGIPTALVNARLSPRSARHYARFRRVTAPILGKLGLVCAQAEEHRQMWTGIGIAEDRVCVTGSLKFDQAEVVAPRRREEFTSMLDAFGSGRPVVLGASTHDGEEVLIARAIRELPGALPVLLPRHAERRREVRNALEGEGFEVVLRSEFSAPDDPRGAAFVVDSTGELRDWTAHADVVVVGKSLLARGGQNPTEAIAASVPAVCGPHMENFEPLITELRREGGIRTTSTGTLADVIQEVLQSARIRREQVASAKSVLARHRGATTRTITELRELIT